MTDVPVGDLEDHVAELGEIQEALLDERAELYKHILQHGLETDNPLYPHQQDERAARKAELELRRAILLPLNLGIDDFEDAPYNTATEEWETLTATGTHRHTIELESGIEAHLVIDQRGFDLDNVESE